MVEGAQPHITNRIYEILTDAVEDEHGLMSGYIAYGVYKEAKREWVKEFWDENDRKPNDDELTAYIKTWTKTRLDGLISEARQSLAEYASIVIEEEAPQIREEAITGRIEKAAKDLQDATKPSLLKLAGSIGVAVLGAFFWSLLLLLIGFILHFSGVDIVEMPSKVAAEQATHDQAIKEKAAREAVEKSQGVKPTPVVVPPKG